MEDFQRRKHPLEQAAIINAVSLNNAVHFYSGDDALGVLGVAEVFRDWLNTVSDKPQESTADIVLPTPTLDQKKVLDEIVKRSGKPMDTVYSAVLNWANETHKVNQYPQQLSSVNSILKWAGWD